jgi:hypothetical protein
MPQISPLAASSSFPLSFYAKAFAVGLVLGAGLEATMSLTSFYDSLRIAEGKKVAREMAEMERLNEEIKSGVGEA